MKKHLSLLVTLFIIFSTFVACGTVREDELINVSPSEYDQVWKITNEVVSKYFDIREADSKSGTIITYDKQMEGLEANRLERAMVKVQRQADSILVDVSCPIIATGPHELADTGIEQSGDFDPLELGVGQQASVETDFELENKIFSEIKRRVKSSISSTSLP